MVDAAEAIHARPKMMTVVAIVAVIPAIYALGKQWRLAWDLE